MYSNPAGRKSVDSLSPLSPSGGRGEFPFHRQSSVTSYPSGRRGSTASSIHSIGGHLDTSTSNWAQGVLESGQNAISTLLQPPIVRTGLLPHTSAPASSTHKPPTAKDIPPVTLTNITKIDPAEFRPYLSQVGALYETLRRAKENEEDGHEQVFRRHSGKADELGDLGGDSHLRPGSRSGPTRKGSIASISSIERPPTVRRSSSNFGRRSVQGPPPLSTIPNVYFDEDFHLENPRTFDVVSERSEVLRPAPGSAEDKSAANGGVVAPRKSLATNAILQEKLSWYMDTIEMHLISSISTASTTFFTALGSLRELHSEAADSVERIKTLREELEKLDEEIASRGLAIVQKRRRRENLQQLNDAVLQLKQIVDHVASCESLVDGGEIEKALDGIDSLEKLVAGEKDSINEDEAKTLQKIQLRDLRNASALQSVNGDISTLRFRIGRAYEAKFINILVGDLRRHVEDVSSQEVLLRWGSAAMRTRGGHTREPSAFPAYLATTEPLRSELIPNIVGLHRAKHITMAITSYREAILREVRNLIRRPLPSSNDDDNESMMSASTMSGKQLTQQEKSSILARNLRALDPEDAEALLVKVYVSVTETLRRLTTQVKVLFDAASLIGEDPEMPSGLRSPQALKSPPLNSANREIQEDIHLAMDMTNLLGQAVDVSQDKIVKVLRVRSDQTSQLPLTWFLRYFTLNLYFANECEAISGRGGAALKTIVNNQIKSFVQQHGDAEKQKLATGMESDQWAAKDFTEKNAAVLDRILESSMKDPQAWLEGSKIWVPQSNDEPQTNGRPRSESNGTAKEKSRPAVIDSENYILPQSAILGLEGINQFLHLIAGIPSMVGDISTSLISYLQLFNSRCTQLILGAGATKSAGLKNITTRHLALAAQALAFMSALIPHIREFVRRHAASGPSSSINNVGVVNLIGEFDKVRRLYQEHQNNIYDKLVEIMGGRAAAHAKTMKAMDWDADNAPQVNDYMEKLAKETVTLHRVLTKNLPESTVRLIMVPVFESYKTQLGKTYMAIEPKTEVGGKRMQQDVEYFTIKLGKIDGVQDVAESLEKIVSKKKSSIPPPTPAKPSIEETTTDASTAKSEDISGAEATDGSKEETNS